MRVLTIPTVEATELPDLQTYASTTAELYGLDPQLFQDVLECESGFNPNAVGDHGTSWGIAQLHDPETDWQISTSTALDPYLSIRIMARMWARGEAGRWTCWHLQQEVYNTRKGY